MGTKTSHEADFRVIQLEPTNEPSESNNFPPNRIKTSKYTLWNFVPKNLFEQFRRVGNFYFLVMTIVAMCIESPVSPLTSSLPLLFVIMVTACKQCYEDLNRFRSDKRINNLPVTVIRNKTSQEISCQYIVVGDFVRVNRDENVPCDLVLLHSSESSGKCCYVTTSNLDGETNLKTLQVPKPFVDFEIADLVSMKATIECQPPREGLYIFEGRFRFSLTNTTEPINQSGHLGIDNLVLRGSMLKNTDYIIGCAVYTGQDTKLSLNSKLIANKFSIAEKSVNRYILIFLTLLIIQVVFCTAMKYRADHFFVTWNVYLGQSCKSQNLNIVEDALSFGLLFSYLVPISLYVTIELQKFLGSFFFGWDVKMYDELTDQPAIANTSDLNEDLGQIEYLFSDKTGTLTENHMIFRRCFINDQVYIEKDCGGSLYLSPPNGNEADAKLVRNWEPEIWHFWIGISLCHSVHIASAAQKAKAEAQRNEYRLSFRSRRLTRENSSLMMDPRLPEYEAASADEKALVEAAARCGVVFLGSNEADADVVEVEARGTILHYHALDIFEFTSDRKRMSVIIKDTDDDIWLYCKGADSSIFPLIHQDNLRLAKNYVADFSRRGLRTLVIGYKKFTQDQYQALITGVSQAREVMGTEQRKKSVEEAYEKFESGLSLLGITAVEDRLQEGVPETLEKLRAAGVKTWVLTGDKAETAENIAFFCGHFKRGTEILRLMNSTTCQQCCGLLTSFERKLKLDPYTSYGLIVDGASARIALRNHPGLLRNVAMACESVVCCRMSPLQKSQIVQLVKSARSKPLTGAIGDGGNDVSMIKEAHVGFGITGKEGREAAMSADFAFAKFQDLERALLVHGNWFYLRIAILVQYFFYKNLVFITPQLLFSIYNGFSSQALYDSMFLMCFNVFFSSAPILVFGISEQNYTEKELLRKPQLYRLYRRNYLLSTNQFILWMFLAIWQTCTIFFIPYFYWYTNPVNLYDSTPADHWCFSTCIFHLVTLVVNIQMLVISSYWTYPFVMSIVLTELFFFAFTFVYTYFNLAPNNNMLMVYPQLLCSPSFWILTFLVVAICLIPTLLSGIYIASRPQRIPGLLETREDSISEIIFSPIESSSSPVLPNRRSHSIIPWRGNCSFYDNQAF